MTDSERIEQIRRAHANAKPTTESPAWLNSHCDVAFLLKCIDKFKKREKDRYYGDLARMQ